MARPRQFDTDAALDGAIAVFSEHGYEGSSAQMLVDAMGIGRQSLYDTFGDKWQLYRAAVRRYGMGECSAHFEALRSGTRAIDGIVAMMDRIVETAAHPCLGTGSTCEFGTSRADLAEINESLGRTLAETVAGRVRDAQREGDISDDIDAGMAAQFLISSIASLRIAGRAGADRATLSGLAGITLRALR